MLQQRRTARKTASNPFAVGDVLKYSWGYDQTNTDFYQVVAKTAKTITIREIGGTWASYTQVSPDKDRFIGPPMVKRIQSDKPYVTMDFGIARRTSVGATHYQTPTNGGH